MKSKIQNIPIPRVAMVFHNTLGDFEHIYVTLNDVTVGVFDDMDDASDCFAALIEAIEPN